MRTRHVSVVVVAALVSAGAVVTTHVLDARVDRTLVTTSAQSDGSMSVTESDLSAASTSGVGESLVLVVWGTRGIVKTCGSACQATR